MDLKLVYIMSANYPYEYERCIDMDRVGDVSQGHADLLEGFNPLLCMTEACGAILLILVTTWTLVYRNSFSGRSNPQVEFNWHPVLMVLALVFLNGNAMLIYRIRRNIRKKQLKLIHAGIMITIIVLTTLALVAVFDSHNLAPQPIPNMYSLHSWVGLTTVILFCCQWVAGCVSFLYPGLKGPLRASYMPLHVYFGMAGFIGAIASALLGLNEKALFVLPDVYSQFAAEGILINSIGMMLVLFGGFTMYLLSQERYRRLPKPEDDALLSG